MDDFLDDLFEIAVILMMFSSAFVMIALGCLALKEVFA